ncbi:RsiV family protein, partial [Klebsiella pneumoniae]|uniref:RsiV family protein n=1 Tax=Klebsiella pneumoniae TaxID=573 RepID=UPI00371319C1
RTTGKRISIRPFFTELADGGPTLTALRTAIIAALKAEKKERGVEDAPEMDWFKDIEPKLLKIGPVSLAPSTVSGKSSGLVFIYSPYAVGSYAEGSYEAYVPWEAVKSFLTPEG